MVVKFRTDPSGATCSFRDYSLSNTQVMESISGSVVPLAMLLRFFTIFEMMVNGATSASVHYG